MAGMDAALDEIAKNEKKKALYLQNSNTDNDTYKKYCEKETELKETFFNLIESLFFTDGYYYHLNSDGTGYVSTHQNSVVWFYNIFIKENWADFKKQIEKGLYKICGTIGQQTDMQTQINDLTKVRNSYLKTINALTKEFNQKYEGYLKEGTWTDSNYLTDNEYYWGGVSVLDNSCKPQTNYSISVIDISKTDIKNADLYEIDIADTSYVEDVDFFGIDPYSGLPNKEKVIISEITYNLDIPMNDTIGVQNYTSSFDDLFQQITASVQSLTYNENIYKRARSFTPKHYVKTDSLQGTLNTGDLTLLNTNNSIKLDRNGTEGNAIQNTSNRYILNGDGLYFSTDGGTRWIQAVSPKGYNMDYAKFGAIDVSKIKLVDNQYVYFLWDQNGINAYNPKNTKDYARFNKNGLSLYKDNKIRMRAGYKNDNITNNTDIGFYLYDLQGKTIFSTQEGVNNSASLKLIGEINVQSAYANSGIAYDLKISCKRNLQNSIYYYFQQHLDNPIGKEYLIVYTNTRSGETYIGANENDEIMIELQQGQTYMISFLKRKFDYNEYIHDIPTSKENGSIIYTSGPLKYFDGENNLLQDNNAQKIYYYEYAYKIVVNQNCILGFKSRPELNNYFCIPGLFNSNTDDNVTFDKSSLESYTTIETEKEWIWTSSSIATSTNRYYLSDTSLTNQKQYINSFQIYEITNRDTSAKKESVLSSGIYTRETKYLQNNKLQMITLYTTDNNTFYEEKTNEQEIVTSGTAIATFINNQEELQGNKLDNDTRLFCIAKQEENANVKNIFSVFPSGDIFIGGSVINKITGEPANDIQNLPDKIQITNATQHWTAQ